LGDNRYNRSKFFSSDNFGSIIGFSLPPELLPGLYNNGLYIQQERVEVIKEVIKESE